MSEPQENLIQFHSGVPGMTDPRPYRSAGGLPEWIKNMPAQTSIPDTGQSLNTVKVCMPFVDAMSCGYIIPLRSTVRFLMRKPDQLEYDHPNVQEHGEAVTYQPATGYQGTPFAQKLVVKFLNHWIIETPPGYSTLFVPLLNQFTIPFQMLAGLVDTDRYYRQVFFPAICLMQPGTSCELERGTPLVQAIPIRRDSWQPTYDTWDVARHREVEQRVSANPHHYRDDTRVKKDYR